MLASVWTKKQAQPYQQSLAIAPLHKTQLLFCIELLLAIARIRPRLHRQTQQLEYQKSREGKRDSRAISALEGEMPFEQRLLPAECNKGRRRERHN